MKQAECICCGEYGDVHEHHKSYHPEETVHACPSCHAKIHHKDGFHDNLKPVNGRPSAYEYYEPDELRDIIQKTCALSGDKCELVHEKVERGDTDGDHKRCIFCGRLFDLNDELIDFGWEVRGVVSPRYVE